MINPTYDKYEYIIYKWSETVKVNTTVRIYGERRTQNTDDIYYVYGIGVSDFLEPDNYDRVKAEEYDRLWFKDNEEAYKEYKDIAGWLFGNNYVSLDDLSRLNNELKEAGAKEVFLHPSFWMSSEPFFIYPIPENDEVRDIMYKNAAHMPMSHKDEMLIAIKKEETNF